MPLPCFITSKHNYVAIFFSSVKHISGISDGNKNNLRRKHAMCTSCLASLTTTKGLYWTPCHQAWSEVGGVSHGGAAAVCVPGTTATGAAGEGEPAGCAAASRRLSLPFGSPQTDRHSLTSSMSNERCFCLHVMQ